MDHLIGHAIDRYHILEQIGRGGMAIVFKAFDTHLERDVAIKVIRRNTFSPDVLERVLKRFEREAKSLAKLTHPNIVSVIDYGEYNESPYLVMPYLPGGTLKDKIGSSLQYSEAINLLLPISEALQYVHQKGIIHRDIKPGNILITESGQPMLTDFGVAHILETEKGITLTNTGVGVGTPEYMAPEQGLGKPVDARTDIYALGIVLYELLTGKKPFTADTPMAVVIKHVTDPIPLPGIILPGIPEQIEKVIIKAIAKNPDNRFQEMIEMQKAMLACREINAENKIHTKNTKQQLSDRPEKVILEPTTDQLLISDHHESSSSVSKKSEKTFFRKPILYIASLFLIITILFILFGFNSLFPVSKTIPTNTLETTEIASNLPGTSTQEINPTITTTIDMIETPSIDKTNSQETITTTATLIKIEETSLTDQLNLVYEESFDSASSNYFSPKNGVWEIITDENDNNVYQASNSDSNEFIWTEFGPKDFSDGIIQYKFKYIDYVNNVPGSGMEYIFFRTQGEWNGDSYAFQLQATNSLADLNYVPENISSWPSLGKKSITLRKDQWYIIRVEVFGNNIKIYFDNRLLIDGTDDYNRFPSGRIGFQVGPRSIVQFDDILIWQGD